MRYVGDRMGHAADRTKSRDVTIVGLGGENTLLTPEPSQEIINHSSPLPAHRSILIDTEFFTVMSGGID